MAKISGVAAWHHRGGETVVKAISAAIESENGAATPRTRRRENNIGIGIVISGSRSAA